MRQKNYAKEYLKGTRRHHWGGRFPTTKFLQSKLGQRWDKVHAELSKQFDRRSYAGYSFWRWGLSHELATDVWIGAETGTVYEISRFGDGIVDGFYVHPFTGIICRQIPPKKVRKIDPITRIVIDDRRAYEKIDGIWYLTEYKKDDIGYYSFYSSIHKQYVVLLKFQLNSKELHANNLTNDPPEMIREARDKAEEERLALKAAQIEAENYEL